MKHSGLSLLLVLQAIIFLQAQTNTGIITSDNKPVGIVENIYGKVIPVIKPPNVDGSPFFCDDWSKATVVFKRGKRADSLPVKFDLQNNLLYYKQDSFVMSFLEEVSSFRFVCSGDASNKAIFFRNNYPLTGQLTTATYFKVLAEGNAFHLLQFINKNIIEEYVYNGPAKRKYQAFEEWFVYDVKANEMLKIKLGKAPLMKKMPSVASKIDELCSRNKWQLKSEEELIKLFWILNE
jgi:hypothetical protein